MTNYAIDQSATCAPRKPKRDSIQHIKDVRICSRSIRSTQEDSDTQSEILFLKPSVFLSDRELLHREVFKKCQEAGLDPSWIDEQSLKEIKGSDQNFYILYQFEGEVYEILKSRKCKTISSFLVRECLREETPLPRINVPVYSKHLIGVRATFTGFSTPEKERLTSLVFALGGHVSPRFSERITHLIANGYSPDNSSKYQAARQLNIAIMDASWLEESWVKAQTHTPFNCTAADFIQEHRMPLLKGLVITKTGISQRQIPDLIRAIEINGGRYSASLTQQCTHMITEICTGDKYKKAKEWERRNISGKLSKRIYLVTIKWLMRSVETGYVLPESRYDPERPTCSTPTHEAPIQDFELSAIPGHENGKLHTQIDFSFHPNNSNMPTADDVRKRDQSLVQISATTLSNTRSEPKLSSLTAMRTSSLRQVDMDEEERVVLQRCASSSLLCQDPAAVLNRRIRELSDPIEDIAKKTEMLNEDLDIMEGTRVMIIGATTSALTSWKRLLNCLGACRMSKIVADTLVIVVRLFSSDDERKLAEARAVGAIAVTAEWAIQCLVQKENLSTHDYLWNDFVSKLERQITAGIENARRDAPFNGIDFPSTSGTSELNNGCETRNENTTRRIMPSQNGLLIDTDDDDEPALMNILEGKTVKIWSVGVTSNDIEDLRKEIESVGGVYTTFSKNNIDYIIFPLIEFGNIPSPTDLKVEQIVTAFWMRCCIEAGKLLEPKESPLYRPIPACSGSLIFKNLVISVTGLEHLLRLEIMDLIQQFGGTFQSCVSKVDKGTNRRNTHVIAGQISEKTIVAAQWGVQIVDPSWLIECVINDKLLPEHIFPVKDAPFSSYAGRKDDVWLTCEMGPFIVEYVEKSTEGGSTFGNRESSLINSSENIPNWQSNHEDHCELHSQDTRCVQVGCEKLQQSAVSTLPASRVFYKPPFRLDDVSQLINGLETQTQKTVASTTESLTIQAAGRILEDAVIKTGKSNSVHEMNSEKKSQTISIGSSFASPERVKREHQLAMRMHEQLAKEQAASTTDIPTKSQTAGISQQSRALKRRRLRVPSQSEDLDAQMTKNTIQTNLSKENDGQPLAKLRAPILPNLPLIDWGEEAHSSQTINHRVGAFDESLAQTPGNLLRDGRPSKRIEQSVAICFKEDSLKDGTMSTKERLQSPVRTNLTSTSTFQAMNKTTARRNEKEWFFNFSNMDSARSHELQKIVIKLGANSLLTTQDERQPWLNKKTTHLITSCIIRNEKCLSAVATGAILLIPQYLDDSYKAGRFLDVEPYEWSKMTMDVLPTGLKKMGSRERLLVESATWWRKHLMEKRNSGETRIGAFAKWRSVIYSKSKSDAIIRIIKCGGGEAVCRSAINDVISYEPTHVLVETCDLWNGEELSKLVQYNIRAFPLDYTCTFLCRNGVLDVLDALPEYNNFIGTKPNSRL